MNKKFYVTTPIYYPNAIPHIGSLYTTLLSDVISRYQKLHGKDVVFLTGTDEHGQKVQEAAKKAGKTELEFVDAISENFKKVFNAYNIDYSIFMRTSSDFHKVEIQKWIMLLQEKGFIYKSFYEGWYSASSESFLLEKDIVEKNSQGVPLCPISKKEAVYLKEEAYFFKLSYFQDLLLDLYDKNPNFIMPHSRKNEAIEFVKSGLRDLCISRSKETLSWGIEFPNDPNQVVYVWADALNNYITAIGYNYDLEKFNSIWPADVQLMGKDIFRFHAIYWPAFLMASELPLPKTLLVHGWILMHNEKMSKSLGNVVDPIALINTYGVDQVRYYLARYMIINQDSSFSYDDLEEKVNSDLSNSLGNLIYRLLSLMKKNNINSVVFNQNIKQKYSDLFVKLETMNVLFSEKMNEYNFHTAFQEIFNFIYYLNAFINDQELWKKIKTAPDIFLEDASVLMYSIHAILNLMSIVIPDSSKKLLSQIGINLIDLNLLKQALIEYTIQNPEVIFKRYEKKEEIMENKNSENTMNKEPEIKKELTNLISIEDFFKTELRVGQIIQIEEIPKADKLYKLTVDFGSFGQRTICSGIKEYYSIENLLNKKAIFVFNLHERMLRGIASQGMILTAEGDKKPSVIMVDQNVENGTLLK